MLIIWINTKSTLTWQAVPHLVPGSQQGNQDRPKEEWLWLQVHPQTQTHCPKSQILCTERGHCTVYKLWIKLVGFWRRANSSRCCSCGQVSAHHCSFQLGSSVPCSLAWTKKKKNWIWASLFAGQFQNGVRTPQNFFQIYRPINDSWLAISILGVFTL